MKKRPFSLVEIAIALPLLALLFSSLLFHFSSTLKLKKDLKVMQKEILDDHYFRRRFQKILYQNADNFNFNQEVLHFDYHNRASINPKACGKVSATLQVLDQSLILRVYHISKRGKEELIREEKFFTDIDQLQWEYIYEFKRENTPNSKANTCPFELAKFSQPQPSNVKRLAAIELSIIKKPSLNKKKKKEEKKEVVYFFNLQPSLVTS